MSTPMYDLPEHFEMPVNDQGQGPETDVSKIAGSVCWCGDTSCEKFKNPPIHDIKPGTNTGALLQTWCGMTVAAEMILITRVAWDRSGNCPDCKTAETPVQPAA